MPAISVIIPVYNVENYLNRCIDSVLAQTFNDFELILVDDGSKDNSLSICNDYANKDDRIKVFHQENRGAAAARNFGVKQACGEFVIFVDSDDAVAEEYLERLFYACIENKSDISLVFFDGNVNEDEAIPEYSDKVIAMTNREAINRYGKRCGPNFRSAVSKLVKREIVVNNLFPEDRVWSEDTACVYKWYWEANRVVEALCVMYFYYCIPGSVSNSNFDDRYVGELDTFEEMLAFFHQNGFHELEEIFVWRYLDTCVEYYFRANSEKNIELAHVFLRRARSFIKMFRKQYQITMAKKTDLFDILYPKRTHIFRIIKRILGKG